MLELKSDLRVVLKQRDELLLALKSIDIYLSDQKHNLDYPHGGTGLQIKQAIEKATTGEINDQL